MICRPHDLAYGELTLQTTAVSFMECHHQEAVRRGVPLTETVVDKAHGALKRLTAHEEVANAIDNKGRCDDLLIAQSEAPPVSRVTGAAPILIHVPRSTLLNGADLQRAAVRHRRYYKRGAERTIIVHRLLQLRNGSRRRYQRFRFDQV